MKSRPFSEDFIKRALVTWTRMAAEGKTNLQVAERLGCHPSMLHYWNSIAPVKGWPLGPVRRQAKPKNARHHSEESKRRAVSALLNRGELTVAEVARGLGVSIALLYRWMRLSGVPNTKVGHLRSKQVDTEIERLGAKRDRLLVEASVLRQTLALLAG
jgi:transposase-like protein